MTEILMEACELLIGLISGIKMQLTYSVVRGDVQWSHGFVRWKALASSV